MQDMARDNHPLQHIEHIALHVGDVRRAVNWYRRGSDIDVLYQDECWALLQLSAVNLALLLTDGQQPARAAAASRHRPRPDTPRAAGDGGLYQSAHGRGAQ